LIKALMPFHQGAIVIGTKTVPVFYYKITFHGTRNLRQRPCSLTSMELQAHNSAACIKCIHK
jgi:hypothetical protein